MELEVLDPLDVDCTWAFFDDAESDANSLIEASCVPSFGLFEGSDARARFHVEGPHGNDRRSDRGTQFLILEDLKALAN